MNVSAEQISGRENMIKRFNKFMLAKIMGIRLRSVGAVFLGGCAGLSLTATILPTVISTVGLTDSFSARLDLAGFAVYSFLLWAVGGWSAQRTGSTQAGGVIVGVVGMVSGLLFTGLSFGTDIMTLLTGGAAGLAYGTVGGMLIANALRQPDESER